MTSAQFEARGANDPSERSARDGGNDAERLTLLHEPRLRHLLRAAVGLSEESQELLVAVAGRLRITERRGPGATAELYP